MFFSTPKNWESMIGDVRSAQTIGNFRDTLSILALTYVYEKLPKGIPQHNYPHSYIVPDMTDVLLCFKSIDNVVAMSCVGLKGENYRINFPRFPGKRVFMAEYPDGTLTTKPDTPLRERDVRMRDRAAENMRSLLENADALPRIQYF